MEEPFGEEGQKRHLIIYHALISDPPEVSIELGSKLNAVDIREGDDVYFECTIDAFPQAERVFWKKDVSI